MVTYTVPSGMAIGYVLAPFHSAHATPIQIVLPADVKEGIGAVQPVHIEVKQGNIPPVFVDYGKGRGL